MALTKKQYSQIREELDNCTKPLFFFHDDPDGLCSFLQFYSYIQEGYGVVVKSRPLIDMKFLSKVETYSPDKIFVLDIAGIEQEFVDSAKRPIIWVDHHPRQEVERVRYFNPMPKDNPCVSYLTYKTVEQSLWIAVVGSISDMYWPKDLLAEFRKKYPGLLPKKIKDVRTALYESDVGKLARIFSAVLKGTSSDAMKYVKALTRVKEPGEILDQEDARGKFIFKRFKEIDREYQKLLRAAKKKVTEDGIALFIYRESKYAFSGDIANEMLYRFPGKLVIIGREKNGEVKCSLRSNDIVLPPLIEKALVGCEGYGGGHDHACGACIKVDDFERFMDNLRKLLEE